MQTWEKTPSLHKSSLAYKRSLAIMYWRSPATLRKNSRAIFWARLALLILGIVSLSGCVTLTDFENTQDYAQDAVSYTDSTQTVGQTIAARRGRLNGITLWLWTDPQTVSGDSVLTVQFFRSVQDTVPLASMALSHRQLAGEHALEINIPLEPLPPAKSYYLLLKSEHSPVWAYGRSEDIYPNGTAYRNGEPLQADLAFRLTYDYDWHAILGDLGQASRQIWLALPLIGVLLLPGWLLLDISRLRHRFDPVSQIGLSLGLSAASVPVLMTWSSLLSIQWNRTGMLAATLLLGCAALWRFYAGARKEAVTGPLESAIETPEKKGIDSPGHHALITVAVAAVFIFSLAVRLAMARDLSTPAWVDSVHHGLVTSLILESGVLPDSYEPYVSVDTANYHAGFHSLLAAFLWLSNMPLAQGMLFFGQVLNASVIFGVYLFTRTWVKEPWAAVLAGLVAGIFTPMPAYYTSWGRYTQLAGLLILPAAYALFRDSLNEAQMQQGINLRKHMPALSLAGLSVAGLFLVHYRVAAFLLCLLAADILARAPLSRPALKLYTRNIAIKGTILGFLAMSFALPWLWPTLSSLLVPKLSEWSGGSTEWFSDFTWRYLTAGTGLYTLALAAAGWLWGVWRLRRFSLALLLWVLSMFMLANLGPLGLPGQNFINNLSVEISLFIPIAALCGYLANQVSNAWQAFLTKKWHVPLQWASATILVGMSIYGAQQLMPILNPVTVLTRQADLEALQWIEEELAPGGTVLINPMPWGYGIYVGRDGGYWISPLTGLPTFPPALLYSFGSPDQVEEVVDLTRQVLENAQDPDALLQVLQQTDVQYVYLGARGGALYASSLADNPHLALRYQFGGVSIFEVVNLR